MVPNFAQPWRPANDVVPAAFAAVGQNSALQLVRVGQGNDFRPRFGVDVEVLLPDGEPDPDLPILSSLPLPAPMGGQEAGMFGFPERAPPW